MSYHVHIYRSETKERYSAAGNLDFLENSENLEPFTKAQSESLSRRLETVGFERAESEPGAIRFENATFGASALLSSSGLYFSANGEEGIFEISMMASEWAADPDLAKFDPQDGQWE